MYIKLFFIYRGFLLNGGPRAFALFTPPLPPNPALTRWFPRGILPFPQPIKKQLRSNSKLVTSIKCGPTFVYLLLLHSRVEH